MKYDTKKIKEYVETLDMPSWGYINKVEQERNRVAITYCDKYHIEIYPESKAEDSVYNDDDCAWGYWDVQFALNILDERDKILKMVEG